MQLGLKGSHPLRLAIAFLLPRQNNKTERMPSTQSFFFIQISSPPQRKRVDSTERIYGRLVDGMFERMKSTRDTKNGALDFHLNQPVITAIHRPLTTGLRSCHRSHRPNSPLWFRPFAIIFNYPFKLDYSCRLIILITRPHRYWDVAVPSVPVTRLWCVNMVRLQGYPSFFLFIPGMFVLPFTRGLS